MHKNPYPRDMIGYGRNPPQANWPGKARIAVQFVLNYEEGGENCVLHGDPGSEQFLSEIIGAASFPARHLSMESIYEYGSRAGVWRILKEFERRRLPLTIFAVGMALERNPEAAQAFVELGHENACHGYRWLHYQDIPESIDYYGDDLPFWMPVALQDNLRKWQLVVPYTLDTNDMRFAAAQGFNTGEQFFTYLKDAFDVLYAEGESTPKMMSVGLHCRIVGRPARFAALQRFLDYIEQHDRVWIPTRADIARHWMEHHPRPDAG